MAPLHTKNMAGKKGIRIIATMECTECKERNYITEKSKRNDPARIELKKYCKRCRSHQMHRETK